MIAEKPQARQQARFLKLLQKAGSDGLPIGIVGEKIVATFNKREYSFPMAIYQDALVAKAVRKRDRQIIITDIGKVIVRKLLHPELEFQNPQQDRVKLPSAASRGNSVDQLHGVLKNLSESPLMRLYSRKDKQGQAYITYEELAAGEKLRSDFERANLQPSVSANWSSNTATSGTKSSNTQADLSDFAIDNRKYVERAISTLGPELSGIALDICCFLKGLELVERERRWPPRSAKLMLKTALSILARHYGLSQNNNRAPGKIEHWGGDNYRPEI